MPNTMGGAPDALTRFKALLSAKAEEYFGYEEFRHHLWRHVTVCVIIVCVVAGYIGSLSQQKNLASTIPDEDRGQVPVLGNSAGDGGIALVGDGSETGGVPSAKSLSSGAGKGSLAGSEVKESEASGSEKGEEGSDVGEEKKKGDDDKEGEKEDKESDKEEAEAEEGKKVSDEEEGGKKEEARRRVRRRRRKEEEEGSSEKRKEEEEKRGC